MNTETAEAPTVVATLAMSGISKSFAGVAALTDVSVEFLAGEVHAILGENGAGKSTLMNIISGTLRPDAGEIVFEGQSIDTLDPREAARLGIAICTSIRPSSTTSPSTRTCRSRCRRRCSPGGTRARRPPARCWTASACTCHLATRRDPDRRQKHLLEIAKALAIKPNVLILDEPTASLDQESTDMLFRRVRDASRERRSSTSPTAWPRSARSRIASPCFATVASAAAGSSARSATRSFWS